MLCTLAVVLGLKCALLTSLLQISSEKETIWFLKVLLLSGVTHSDEADTLRRAEGTSVDSTAAQTLSQDEGSVPRRASCLWCSAELLPRSCLRPQRR